MEREEAREYFNNSGLSYDCINMNDIYRLIQLLNVEISKLNRHMLMMNEPSRKKVKIKENGLIYARLEVKGTYFADREAITFNEDGFIGFCGWADGCNSKAIIDGFINWCDYLKEKKVLNEII